jgi:hypothetical protein
MHEVCCRGYKQTFSMQTRKLIHERDIGQILTALRNWQVDALNEDLAARSLATSKSTGRSRTTKSTASASV